MVATVSHISLNKLDTLLYISPILYFAVLLYAPAAWPAKPSNTKERSALALVQQYPQQSSSSNMRSSIMGKLTNVMVPLNSDSGQLTSAQCPKEVRDYISICERCTVVPCFRKNEGDMMLGMVIQ